MRKDLSQISVYEKLDATCDHIISFIRSPVYILVGIFISIYTHTERHIYNTYIILHKKFIIIISCEKIHFLHLYVSYILLSYKLHPDKIFPARVNGLHKLNLLVLVLVNII